MAGGPVDRRRLAFRVVNRRGEPGYQAGMQRHHLLPRELLSRRCFASLFDAVGRDRLGFHDFRRNGLLLPSNGEAAVHMGLPLHRGPHRTYSGLVAERIGQIEGTWSHSRSKAPERERDQAFMRLTLLQRALRRRLLRPDRPRLRLNRQDPPGAGLDFSELDAMAELLWADTASVNSRP
jgi:hypothetical protein